MKQSSLCSPDAEALTAVAAAAAAVAASAAWFSSLTETMQEGIKATSTS